MKMISSENDQIEFVVKNTNLDIDPDDSDEEIPEVMTERFYNP